MLPSFLVPFVEGLPYFYPPHGGVYLSLSRGYRGRLQRPPPSLRDTSAGGGHKRLSPSGELLFSCPPLEGRLCRNVIAKEQQRLKQSPK